MNQPIPLRVALVALSIVVLGAGVLGCGRDARKGDQETPTPRVREGDDGARTISLGATNVTMSGVTLHVPADWPEAIPVHPDAEVSGAQSFSAEDRDGTAYRLELVVADPSLSAVAEWYVASLSEQGWHIVDQLERGDGDLLERAYEATRVDGALSVVLREQEDHTSVYIEAGLLDEMPG